jgi:hypothetical protein
MAPIHTGVMTRHAGIRPPSLPGTGKPRRQAKIAGSPLLCGKDICRGIRRPGSGPPALARAVLLRAGKCW